MTVNGIVAVVYMCEFIVKHVSLEKKEHIITVIAFQQADSTHVFDHYGDYSEDKNERKNLIDQINELERWLNEEMQQFSRVHGNCIAANP